MIMSSTLKVTRVCMCECAQQLPAGLSVEMFLKLSQRLVKSPLF